MDGYIYYWYHFGMDSATREAISDSINDGEYETFKKYKEKYPENLPDEATLWKDGDIVGHGNILDKEVFDNIVYNESENG